VFCRLLYIQYIAQNRVNGVYASAAVVEGREPPGYAEHRVCDLEKSPCPRGRLRTDEKCNNSPAHRFGRAVVRGKN